MAAVTQTIPNYLGGVSNQPDDKKRPGQVTKCINAYPDPTFGLTKRPGFKFLTTLKETGGAAFDNTDLDNAKWFYINRDADERYIGCIVGHGTPATAAIHIWNAIPTGGGVYTKATISYPPNGLGNDSLAGSNYEPRTYLSSTTATDYDVLTIQDTYYITNKAVTVAAHTAPTFNARYRATVVLNGTTNGLYKITFDPDSGSDEVEDYTASGATADTILDDLASNWGTSNLTVTKYGNTLEFTYNAAFKLTVQSPSGTELKTYQDEVNSINDLPVLTATDRVVKILNTGADEDDYYVKFNGTTKVWEETVSAT